MAGIPQVKCVGPSYSLADRKSASQRSVNLFMRQVEGLGEDRQVVLDSAPGLQVLVTMPDAVRGMRNVEGAWYVVAGSNLYRVFTDGAYTASLGTLASSTGFVGMAHGENQLVMVDGPNGYVIDLLTLNFGAITSDGWRGSYGVQFLDG
jgi:hypothetical protein